MNLNLWTSCPTGGALELIQTECNSVELKNKNADFSGVKFFLFHQVFDRVYRVQFVDSPPPIFFTRRLIVMAITKPEYSQQSLASHHLQLEQVRWPMRQKHEATCCFGRGVMSSATFILCFYPQNKVKERLSDLSHYKHLSCFGLFHWLLPLPEKQQHFYSCAKMLITKYHFLVRNLITHSVTDVLHKLFL